MRRILRIAAVAIAAISLLGAFASNQMLSRSDIYSNIGSPFAWAGAAQTSWNGDHTLVSWSEFTQYVKNTGSCAQPGGLPNGIMNYSTATACAVSASVHSPIVANGSFAGASFASWSSLTPTGCTTAVPAATAVSSFDTDADGGGAQLSSGTSCTSAGTIVGITQTFTIAGNPTSQSISLWYSGSHATAGTAGCTVGSGSITNFQALINGALVTTIGSPYQEAQLSIATGLLVSGSNTITIRATLQGATGTTGTGCATPVAAAQTLQLDQIKLTSTY